MNEKFHNPTSTFTSVHSQACTPFDRTNKHMTTLSARSRSAWVKEIHKRTSKGLEIRRTSLFTRGMRLVSEYPDFLIKKRFLGGK